MPRVDARARDPQRFSYVQAEQRKLQEQYANHICIARLCPYCQFKVEILYQGSHGATSTKCAQCGEIVFFPPVVFRFAC